MRINARVFLGFMEIVSESYEIILVKNINVY
jgi:hypothetical protein